MLKPSLKLLGILYFLVSNYTGLCQNEFSKWYFGDKAAIDFISGSPVVLTNSKTLVQLPTLLATYYFIMMEFKFTIKTIKPCQMEAVWARMNPQVMLHWQ